MKMLTVIDRVLLLGAFSALFLASACGKNDAADDSTDVGAAPEVINEIELEPVTPTEQVELAYKYFLGEEKPQDYQRAAGLFLKAAKNGNSDAQFALGCMYQNGQGVQRNFMEAAKWYLKSAQAGNPNGQYLIGLSFKEGSGVPKDTIESYKWIHLAAEQQVDPRHSEARDQLALLLTPAVVAEGKRRADQFLLYQGLKN